MRKWVPVALAVFVLSGCEATTTYSGVSSRGHQMIAEAGNLGSATSGQFSVFSPTAQWRCQATRPWTFGAVNETLPLLCSDKRSGTLRIGPAGLTQGSVFVQLSDGETGQLTFTDQVNEALLALGGVAAATGGGSSQPSARAPIPAGGGGSCRLPESTCQRESMTPARYNECISRPICGMPGANTGASRPTSMSVPASGSTVQSRRAGDAGSPVFSQPARDASGCFSVGFEGSSARMYNRCSAPIIVQWRNQEECPNGCNTGRMNPGARTANRASISGPLSYNACFFDDWSRGACQLQ